ncbi:MAG TPA: hypothetical protein VGF06_00490 [Terriglobales bacterium]
MRMPALNRSVNAALLCLALSAPMLLAEDLHFKKNISIGGSQVSNSETWVKGARERTLDSSPAGNVITLRQCDLKRTLTINEQSQTYLVISDPQDESAAQAAAFMNGTAAPVPQGGTITQTVTVTDTGERKQISGFNARHLKTTVAVEASPKACSHVSQKYQIDGWYADLDKGQASCRQALPQIRQTEGCSDRVIVRHRGTGKPGYPLLESIHLENEDGTSTQIDVATADIARQTLNADLFEMPAGYREVKSAAELYSVPQPSAPPAAPQPVVYNSQQLSSNNLVPPNSSQFSGFSGQNAMLAQAQQMAFAGGMQGLTAQMQSTMPGANTPSSAPVPLPQAVGPKAPGKIRIGIAPAQAQMGQGNNAQADYGTPIRNAIIYIMNGPAVEIVALDARIPIQLQAEAQQKQCDYILLSGVTVKHSGGGFGSFMKKAGPMSSMIPMAGMAGGMTGAMAGQAAAAAAQMAAQSAQEQAMNQLAGFNGQIKSKDDVTIEYHLYPTGQDKARLENTLKGKAKTDGEDVLSPLIQQAATTVLTEVTKK